MQKKDVSELQKITLQRMRSLNYTQMFSIFKYVELIRSEDNSWQETLEILANPKLTEALSRAQTDRKKKKKSAYCSLESL